MGEADVINIIAELPDGCLPVFVYLPHPEGGNYCVDAIVYGLAGRLPRFISYKGEYMASEEPQDLAKEHAARAARQAKHAARNLGEATVHEKDHIVESVERAAEPINPRGLVLLMGNVGGGIFATAVSITSAVIATQKFRAAYEGRRKVVVK